MSTGRMLSIEKHEYEMVTDRLRSTSLKELLEPQGPRAYYWEVVCAGKKLTEEEQTEAWNTDSTYRSKNEALMLGKLFHEFLIEDMVGWYETGVRRDCRVKDYQKVLDACGGKPILSKAEAELMWQWREGVYRNKDARAILEGPRFTEQVVMWDEIVRVAEGEVTIPCMMSLDLWAPSVWACLKTTRIKIKGNYEREVHHRRYDVSAAFYERGIRSVPELSNVRVPFKHIVLYKEPPFYCYVWEVSRVWMNSGKRDVERALDTLARCILRERDLPPDQRIEAYPDWQETGDTHLVPHTWMLTEYGETPSNYDPFGGYEK